MPVYGDLKRALKKDASCFAKAKKKKEPTFTVRAQDHSAPTAVVSWIMANIYTCPAEKLRDALEIAIAMRNWPDSKKKSAD